VCGTVATLGQGHNILERDPGTSDTTLTYHYHIINEMNLNDCTLPK